MLKVLRMGNEVEGRRDIEVEGGDRGWGEEFIVGDVVK